MTDAEPRRSAAEAPPREIIAFLWFTLREIGRRRKWFLIPFWTALLLLALVLFLLGGSYLLPAIYIAF